MARRRSRLLRRLLWLFGRPHIRIGIYGPPNAGKTTLANTIARDLVGDDVGPTSDIPHETRRVTTKRGLILQHKNKKIYLDIADTPGIATKIDYKEFMKYGLDEEEAKRRAKEATEGVIEAIKWLDEVDGVIVVMDSTQDPYTQVNITILGNLEARKIPTIIAANKIDLPNAAPGKIIAAFPQHVVIPISALRGDNLEELYKAIIKHFR